MSPAATFSCIARSRRDHGWESTARSPCSTSSTRARSPRAASGRSESDARSSGSVTVSPSPNSSSTASRRSPAAVCTATTRPTPCDPYTTRVPTVSPGRLLPSIGPVWCSGALGRACLRLLSFCLLLGRFVPGGSGRGLLRLLALALLLLCLFARALAGSLRAPSGHLNLPFSTRMATGRDASRRRLPGSLADHGYVRRLRAFLALLRLVLDARTLGEGPVALALDRREVDEQVLAAVGRRDEPVALVAVEPLHGSGCHLENTSFAN